MILRIIFFLTLCLSLVAIGNAQDYPYVFVFLNSRTDKAELPKGELDELMKGHLANIERLAKEGKLLVAGPFEGGGGIFIFKSQSVDQVKEWLSTDPGVRAERWLIEILPYKPQVGNVCTAKEPYEMVTYQFIRFESVITKFSVHHASESFEKHNQFVKDLAETGNVVTAGVFANQDGAILLMKGEIEPSLVEANPAVKDGLLRPSFKKLWVAKGSFCE